MMLAPLCLGLSLGSVGCSGDKAKKIKQAAKNLVDDPSLNGAFVDDCTSSKLLDASERIEMIFAGSQFTQHQIFYDNKDCKSEIGRITYKGEFRTDSDALPQTDGGALEVELEEAKIEIKNQKFADLANGVNLCGTNNYEVGKSVELKESMKESKNPITNAVCPVTKVPVTVYGAYTVHDGKLAISDGAVTSMADSKDNRKTNLNHDHMYKRK